MGEKIYRDKPMTEEVEVPEGHEKCVGCGGRGTVSKYDMGWRSLMHSEELAARRTCQACQGQGHHPKGETLGFNMAV